MLGIIKYRQITNNLFDDINLHPIVKKELEEIHYALDHNLPCSKELLF